MIYVPKIYSSSHYGVEIDCSNTPSLYPYCRNATPTEMVGCIIFLMIFIVVFSFQDIMTERREYKVYRVKALAKISKINDVNEKSSLLTRELEVLKSDGLSLTYSVVDGKSCWQKFERTSEISPPMKFNPTPKYLRFAMLFTTGKFGPKYGMIHNPDFVVHTRSQLTHEERRKLEQEIDKIKKELSVLNLQLYYLQSNNRLWNKFLRSEYGV